MTLYDSAQFLLTYIGHHNTRTMTLIGFTPLHKNWVFLFILLSYFPRFGFNIYYDWKSCLNFLIFFWINFRQFNSVNRMRKSFMYWIFREDLSYPEFRNKAKQTGAELDQLLFLWLSSSSTTHNHLSLANLKPQPYVPPLAISQAGLYQQIFHSRRHQ